MAKVLTEYKGYPLGVNTDPEKTIAQMQDISIHQNCCQIPFYFLAEEKIDKDLLLKAVNEEIRRNDSLRMRWIKKGFLVNSVRYHYFLEEYVMDDIPELDVTGKTMEEMTAALEADAAVTVKYLKGEVFRIKLLHAPDGRDGIYFISTHMNLDLCGMLITIRDLLEVYNALKNGTEMPKPM